VRMDKLTLVFFVLIVSRCSFSGEIISPDELYGRMCQNAHVQVETAQGQYIRRAYNPQLKSDAQIRAEVDRTVQEVIDNSKDKDKITAQIPLIRKQLEDQYRRTTSTSLDTYYLSGAKQRTDRWMLTDDRPLDEIRKGVPRFSQEADYSVVWNGRAEGIFDRSSLKETQTPGHQPLQRLVLSSNPPKAQDNFLSYGRGADDNLLTIFRKQGLPISVDSTTYKGEDALTLRIGAKNTVGFLLEATVLPNKGYVMAESSVKMAGAVQMIERYDEFTLTSAGFWIPKKIFRESYGLDERRVPVLRARLEMIALQDPKVNIPLDDSLFSLIPTADAIVSDRRSGKVLGYFLPSFSRVVEESNLIPTISKGLPARENLYRLEGANGSVNGTRGHKDKEKENQGQPFHAANRGDQARLPVASGRSIPELLIMSVMIALVPILAIYLILRRTHRRNGKGKCGGVDEK